MDLMVWIIVLFLMGETTVRAGLRLCDYFGFDGRDHGRLKTGQECQQVIEVGFL